VRTRGVFIAPFVVVLAALGFARAQAPSRAASGPTPIVILVSLDGWRWDYIDNAPTPHLRALADRGIPRKD